MDRKEPLKMSSTFGRLIKAPSDENPSIALRQASKKIKTSKSSNIVQRSLVPQKESNYSEEASHEIISKKNSELPKECKCGPDLYSRVLGPTADETILTGLQTLIDLCNKLRVCGDKDESGDEEPEREQDLPERDTSSKMKTTKSQTDSNSVSAAFQVNPSVKSTSSQTKNYPEMVSEILQTVGFTPEMVSKVMQTSFVESVPKKPSVTTIFTQTSNTPLVSEAIQTAQPEVEFNLTQAGSGLFPKTLAPKASATTQSDLIETMNRETMSDIISTRNNGSMIKSSKSDEHKNIAPPSPPSSKEHCKCCKCVSSYDLKRNGKGSKSSLSRTCVCGMKRASKCICDPKRRSVISVEGDQQPPLEVKYAVTKISKYKEFTTFEVMKSTKNIPRQMPKAIEGVFVLRKKNGNGKNPKVYEMKDSKTTLDGNGSNVMKVEAN